MAKKNPAAVHLGRKGGKAAAKNRTKKERAELARKAARARWSKAQKIDSPG
jgi:aminoglycoside phosphotransferase